MAAKLQHCPYKRRKEEGLSTIIHPSEKGEEAPKCILMSVIITIKLCCQDQKRRPQVRSVIG